MYKAQLYILSLPNFIIYLHMHLINITSSLFWNVIKTHVEQSIILFWLDYHMSIPNTETKRDIQKGE